MTSSLLSFPGQFSVFQMISLMLWFELFQFLRGFSIRPVFCLFTSFFEMHNIKRTQSRIICAILNGNQCTTIVPCYNPIIANDESDVTIFKDGLASLVRLIPKHNVLIIGRDMNAQIGKDENNKFRRHDTQNRKG